MVPVWGHEPAHAGGGGGAVEGRGRDALLVVGKSATMMAEFCYFLGVHTSVTHKTKIAQRQPLPPNRCNNFTTIITIYQ